MPHRSGKNPRGHEGSGGARRSRCESNRGQAFHEGHGRPCVEYRTKKARVIDDYPSMRSAFKMALASFGMTKVDVAANGSEAILRAKGSGYDVIICDYNLGEGRDGEQVLEEMRHRSLIGLETAFLMVTAESVYEREVAAAELAPDDYLIKPFNGEILRTRLDAILLNKGGLPDRL